MKFIVIVVAVCCIPLIKGRPNYAEFEEYKRTHLEEFSGQTEGDMVMLGRNAYTGITKWTNGVVPFDMSAMSYSAQERIQSALQELQNRVGSCIKFIKRTTERNYVRVNSLNGCYSYVGMNGGAQQMSLQENGCLGAGTIQHEFIHALGFMHEQSRSDRDSYLDIHWENISPDMQYNFQKLNSNNQGFPYTYTSVMHYGKYAFSQNGLPSMTPKDPNAKIGVRVLHDRDVEMIQKFYGCSGGSGGTDDCKDDPRYSCTSYLNYCQDPGWVDYLKDTCPKTCGYCNING